jgi:hypothetical protein
VTPDITLSRALADPALLGAPFQAASFWTWKTVAKLIDGLPLNEPREVMHRTQQAALPIKKFSV